MCQGQKSLYIAICYMVIAPSTGNPSNWYVNPYYWVDDQPLSYGNHGSLDPSICSLREMIMFTKAPNKSRIRSKVTNNQDKSTNLWLEWITYMFTFPQKKGSPELPPSTYYFDPLFPQKLKWQWKNPSRLVSPLNKNRPNCLRFLDCRNTVPSFKERQVTGCRAWTMHLLVGAILLQIWMFGQHLRRVKCRKVFVI